MNKTDLVVVVARRDSLPALLEERGLAIVATGDEPATQATVNQAYKEIVDTVLADVLDTIGMSLSAGEQINLRGFGHFDPRDRKPVVRLNPATQEPIQVPAKRSVGFVPSQLLKDRVNGGKP